MKIFYNFLIVAIVFMFNGLLYAQSNDNCADAIPLTVSSDCQPVSYSTTYSTIEDVTVAPDPTCIGSYSGDVWFTAIMPSSGIMRIEITGYYSLFELYSGICGSLNQIICNDGTYKSRTIHEPSLAGQTIYIRVYSQCIECQGDFTICVRESPVPVNDNCAEAIPLPVNSSCQPGSYTNAFATAEPFSIAPYPACGDYMGGDVWFTFTMPVSGRLKIETTGPASVYEIYTGSCGSLTDYMCSNYTNDYTGGTTVNDPSLAGQTLYIRVFSWPDESEGPFTLCLWEPPLPLNDNCADAIPLNVNSDCQPGSYTNAFASLEPVSVSPDPACSGFFTGDVWFTAIMPVSGILRVETTGPASLFAIYSGSCGSFTEIACNDGSYTSKTIHETSLAGQTIYIRVFSSLMEEEGIFYICLRESPVPVNDNCADAIPLVVNPSCQPENYTNAFATTEPLSIAPNSLCESYPGGDVWFTASMPLSGALRVETTGPASEFEIYTGSCGSLINLNCSNYSGATTVNAGNLAGQTIYIRVILSPGETEGPFSICLWEPPIPVNDNCADAIPLTSGSSCQLGNYTNVYATAESDSVTAMPSCGYYNGGDVWFKAVVPLSGAFRIEMVSGIQPAFVIYTGICGSFTEYTCAGTTGTSLTKTFHDATLAGQTIYIRVSSYYGYATGPFSLCFWEPPIPVNDNCADAIPLTVNSSCQAGNYTNAYATKESLSVAPNPTCGNNLGGDVWFTATVPLSGSLVIQTTGSARAFVIYTGVCGSLTQFLCNFSSTKTLLEPSLAGQTIYIRVLSSASNTGGPFTICLWELPIPANDNCANAIPLPVNSSCQMVNYTNLYATTEADSIAPPPTCGEYMAGDVWFTATMPLSGVLKIETTRNTLEVVIYTGICGAFTQKYCIINNLHKIINEPSLGGQTIYIRVLTWDNDQGGTFGICLWEPQVPVNDNCTGAIPLTVHTNCIPEDFDNTNSSTEPDSSASATSCNNDIGGDVWFKATMPSSGIMRIETSGPAYTFMLYTGTCGSLSQFFCSNPPTTTIHEPSLAGQTIYIRIFNSGNDGGPCSICLWTPALPVNDDCANAIEIPAGSSCQPGNYTNAYATVSPDSIVSASSCGFDQSGDVWFKTVMPSSGALRMEFTGIEPVFLLYSGICGSLTELMCAGAGGGTYSKTLNEPSLAGQTIYIRVFSYRNIEGGAFSLCIWEPPIPVNDHCANAIPLPVNSSCQPAVYTNAYATPEPLSVAPYNSCGSDPNNDVWFTVVMPGSGKLGITGTLLGYNIPVMTLYSGSCGALTYVSCYYLGDANFIDFPSLGGQTLYVRVVSYNNEAGGDFTLCAYDTTCHTPPDAVNQLLPANNSSNVQLPILFSWEASLYATRYDLFIWRSDLQRPAVPSLANLGGTNYVYNDYLNTNYLYKWQVVASNQCSPAQSQSEIHLFSFHDMPDLTLSGVTKPDSAISGTSVSISYTLNNIGLAATEYQTCNDEIYLSLLPDFDVSTAVKAGTVQNTVQLLPGGSKINSANISLNNSLEGAYYLFIKTNSPGTIQESDFGNNIARSAGTLVVQSPPLPDLWVHDILPAQGSIVPDSALTLSWIVENTGNKIAVGGWSEKISLVAGPKKLLLGYVQYDDSLAASGILSQNITFPVPRVLGFDGDVFIEVQLIPHSALIEKPNSEANNTALSATPISAVKRLFISIPEQSINEDSTVPLQCSLTRSGYQDYSLAINLQVSDVNRINYPGTLTIPANQAGQAFEISSIDNNLMEGDKVLSLSGYGSGYPLTSQSITVIDDEKPSLHVRISAIAANEGDSVQVRLSRDFASGSPIQVNLAANLPTQVGLPASVTINGGDTAATFIMVIINDQIPESSQNIILTAFADGYNTGSDTVIINQNDILSLQFNIHPDTVSESGGLHAATGKIQRHVAGSETITLNLTAQPAGRVIIPSQIVIPAGQLMKEFYIGVIDNAVMEGTQQVTITATMFLSSCSCNVAPALGGVVSANLAIIDNDGPSLTVTADPFVVPENMVNAGTLKVQRNTPQGSPLDVIIHNDRPDKVDIISQAVIPADQDYVSVPFNTLYNNTVDGTQEVVFEATAASYNMGTCQLMVTDQTLPDLIFTGLTVSTDSLYYHAKLPLNLQLSNIGFATAASGVSVNLYLSKDPYFDNSDVQLQLLHTNSAISPGVTLSIDDTLDLSAQPGNYYLIAIVNKDAHINELDYLNDQSAGLAFAVLPDFTATVSVDGDVFNGNTPILINGTSVTNNNQPAIHRSIDVYVVVNGVRRDFITSSDSSGAFSYSFQPLNGEAGAYYVGACFPGQGLNVAQDGFTVLGMKYTGDKIRWDLHLNQSVDSTLLIKNFSSHELNNVSIQVIHAPPGCSLSFGQIGNLPGNGTASLSYTVNATAVSGSIDYSIVKLRITSAEGADYDFDAWFICKSPSAYIILNPPGLLAKMVPNKKSIEEFEIQNIGMEGTGTIHISLPALSWLSLVSPDSIPSIPSGGKAVVSLRLSPGSDIALNTAFTGSISVACQQGNTAALAFSIEAISQETGDLSVDVVDEFSFSPEFGQHVSGAHVILRHPYTGAILAEGNTNSSGLFNAENIPSGNYILAVTALKHNTYQANVTIKKGIVNAEVVFISYQAITYTWNVVPTLIGDSYSISLVTTFETHVPKPVVTFDMPDTIPHLQQGEVFPFLVTLTNIGLITAHDVTLNLPVMSEYTFTMLADKFDLMAQQMVQIPVVMQRKDVVKGDGGGDCPSSDVTYTYVCGVDSSNTDGTGKSLYYGGADCSASSTIGGGAAGGEGGAAGGTWEIVSTAEGNCDVCIAAAAKWMLTCGCSLAGPFGGPICWGIGAMDCAMSVETNCHYNYTGKMACAGAIAGCTPPGGIYNCFSDFQQLCAPPPGGPPGSGGGPPITKTPPSFLVEAQNKMKVAIKEDSAISCIDLEIYNDSAWINSPYAEINYFSAYFQSLGTTSEIAITSELIAHKPSNISQTQLENFITRWNNNIRQENNLSYDSTNVISQERIDSCYQVMLDCEYRSQEMGYASTGDLIQSILNLIQEKINIHSSSVCASVSVKFSQTLTMTREAFEGSLTVYNGNETKSMQNIALQFEIKDQAGNIRNDLFQINTLSLTGITGIDGTGIVDTLSSGTAVIRFIPEKGAAPLLPASYSFGGTISYLDPYTDTQITKSLAPVTLQVNPSPDLYLTYFMERTIMGDNPLTKPVEPSVPAELAVMINNKGAGIARHLQLESAQPVIVENEKGLLIDFHITGSNLGGKPQQLGLLDVDFGDIPGNKIAIGQWWFTSTLLGHFTSYESSVNHLDSRGNQDLSLISGSEIHELIHSISAYGALDDSIDDFLVNDIPDANDLPDKIYFSTGTKTDVYLADSSMVDGPVTRTDTVVVMTVYPHISGWNYTRLNDPGNGRYTIVSVTRFDGQVIPLKNIWLTYCTVPDAADPVYENKMHFTDVFEDLSPVNYTIVFKRIDFNVPKIISITGIPQNISDVSVDSVDVIFNKAIDPATFDYSDLFMRCQGGPNLIDSTVVVHPVNDTIFRVFLKGKTDSAGYYVLDVQAAGISDLVGNTGTEGMQVSWTQGFNVPFIQNFIGIPAGTGEPTDTILVLFTMPIEVNTFTTDQVILTFNNNDTIATGSLAITPVGTDSKLFRISGLLPLTITEGDYRLKIIVTQIAGENGRNGLIDESIHWQVCSSIQPVAFAGEDASTCINSPYHFSGTAAHAGSVKWLSSGTGVFDDDLILDPTYTAGQADIDAGFVKITLIAFPVNSCASADTGYTYLYFIPNPVPLITGITEPCEGTTGNVYETETGMTGYLWSVTAGGTITSADTTNTVTVSWNTSGINTVFVNYRNSQGCVADLPSQLQVNVAPLPLAAGTISGPDTIIPGQTGAVYSIDPIGGASGYEWILPDGATVVSGINTNMITVDFSDTITGPAINVYGTNACGNGAASPPLGLTVMARITGVVTYRNSINTPLTTTNLQLFRNDIMIESLNTGSSGNYSFVVQPGGTYTIQASSAKLWGGVNATDAFLISKHFAGLSSLTGQFLTAADVDGSGNVNSMDALLATERYVGLISSFSVGDWVFNKDTIEIDGPGHFYHDIYALCYGDVNGSFNPLSKKMPAVRIISDDIIKLVQGEPAFLPVQVTHDLNSSAISLVLKFPAQLFSIQKIIPMPGLKNFIYNIKEGEIRIGWYQDEPVNFEAGDTLFMIKLNIPTGFLTTGKTGALETGDESECADIYGQIIPDVVLSIPSFGLENNPLENLVSEFHPNPATEMSEITIKINEESGIEQVLMDNVGQVVRLFQSENVKAGTLKREINIRGLSAGVYFYRIQIIGKTRQQTEVRKLVITGH